MSSAGFFTRSSPRHASSRSAKCGVDERTTTGTGRVGPGWDQLGNRTTDEDYKTLLKNMKRRPLDYFKDFYADSAVFGSKAATECGLSFYGADKVLFASDCPFDPEKGPGYIRDTIKILESLDISKAALNKIAYKNAQKLLGIK